MAAIAAVVVVVLWIDVEEIVRTAKQADPGLLLAVLALLPLNVLLEAYVWRPFVRVIGSARTTRSLLRSTLAGFAFAIVTPARIGEFYGRTVDSARQDRWAVGASVVVSRISESIVLALFGIVALIAGWAKYGSIDGLKWPPVLLMVASFWLVLLLAAFFVPADRLARFEVGRLKKVIEPFRFLDKVSVGARIEALLFGAARYVVFAAQFVLAARAFGMEVDLAFLVSTTAVAFLMRALAPPLTFLDLGIREGVTAFVFGQVGLAVAPAFNAALAIFGINVLLPALVGIPFATRVLDSDDETVDTGGAEG